MMCLWDSHLPIPEMDMSYDSIYTVYFFSFPFTLRSFYTYFRRVDSYWLSPSDCRLRISARLSFRLLFSDMTFSSRSVSSSTRIQQLSNQLLSRTFAESASMRSTSTNLDVTLMRSCLSFCSCSQSPSMIVLNLMRHCYSYFCMMTGAYRICCLRRSISSSLIYSSLSYSSMMAQNQLMQLSDSRFSFTVVQVSCSSLLWFSSFRIFTSCFAYPSYILVSPSSILVSVSSFLVYSSSCLYMAIMPSNLSVASLSSTEKTCSLAQMMPWISWASQYCRLNPSDSTRFWKCVICSFMAVFSCSSLSISSLREISVWLTIWMMSSSQFVSSRSYCSRSSNCLSSCATSSSLTVSSSSRPSLSAFTSPNSLRRESICRICRAKSACRVAILLSLQSLSLVRQSTFSSSNSASSSSNFFARYTPCWISSSSLSESFLPMTVASLSFFSASCRSLRSCETSSFSCKFSSLRMRSLSSNLSRIDRLLSFSVIMMVGLS